MQSVRTGIAIPLALLLFAACGEDATGPQPQLTELVKVAGDAQTDTVTRELDQPIELQALDQNEKPMEGILITFAVTGGGGNTFSGFAITDAEGSVFDVWRLGETAGQQTLEARAQVPGTQERLSIEFVATALPDSAARIQLTVDSVTTARGDSLFVKEMAQFTALAFDRYENAIARTDFRWLVSNVQLASIDANGELIALDEGTVVVFVGMGQVEERHTLFLLPERQPPFVNIVNPPDNSEFNEGDVLTAVANAGDPDGGPVTVVWTSNVDGLLGQGEELELSLSVGLHNLKAEVTDDEGATAADSVAVLISTEPTADIVSPLEFGLFELGTLVTFEVVAEDRDGGDVTISWESDLDGVLSSDAMFTSAALSAGVHRILVTVEDDEGVQAFDSLFLSVQAFGASSAAALEFAFVSLSPNEEDGDYVEVPDDDALDLIDNWTLEAWIKPSAEGLAGGPHIRHIVSKWDGGGNASWVLQLKGRRVSVAIHNGVRTTTLESEALVVADEWQHVAATFDFGVANVYLNGMLVASMNTGILPMASDRPVSIGREGPPENMSYFGGAIDEVRIWGATRTEAGIRSKMLTTLSGGEADLVAYWRFDEGMGDTAADATAGGHDGRLGDAPTPDARDPAWITAGAPVN